MTRDLRIGRPDLSRQYDDGGLVDLNTAPVQAPGASLRHGGRGITSSAASGRTDSKTASCRSRWRIRFCPNPSTTFWLRRRTPTTTCTWNGSKITLRNRGAAPPKGPWN
jgi:hypothetical protein